MRNIFEKFDKEKIKDDNYINNFITDIISFLNTNNDCIEVKNNILKDRGVNNPEDFTLYSPIPIKLIIKGYLINYASNSKDLSFASIVNSILDTIKKERFPIIFIQKCAYSKVFKDINKMCYNYVCAGHNDAYALISSVYIYMRMYKQILTKDQIKEINDSLYNFASNIFTTLDATFTDLFIYQKCFPLLDTEAMMISNKYKNNPLNYGFNMYDILYTILYKHIILQKSLLAENIVNECITFVVNNINPIIESNDNIISRVTDVILKYFDDNEKYLDKCSYLCFRSRADDYNTSILSEMEPVASDIITSNNRIDVDVKNKVNKVNMNKMKVDRDIVSKYDNIIDELNDLHRDMCEIISSNTLNSADKRILSYTDKLLKIVSKLTNISKRSNKYENKLF